MARLDPIEEQIDATWFGAGLTEASRSRLTGLARMLDAPSGTVLVREGHEARELCLLVHGRVALSESVPERGDVRLMVVEPGDIYGWSALVAPFRATTTVTAIDPVRAICFDGSGLRSAVRADPVLAAGIYQQVLEAVARRLVATRRQLVALSGTDADPPASGGAPGA